jgi:hypothetical protein
MAWNLGAFPVMLQNVFQGKSGDNYRVTCPVAAFLEAAVGIPADISLNTTWKASRWTPKGADAITTGSTVRFTPNLIHRQNITFWISIICHEHTHRVDYEGEGPIRFLWQYGLSYLKGRLWHRQTHMEAYMNEPAEKKAYANQYIIDVFFSNAENREAFSGIINSGLISDDEKCARLSEFASKQIKPIEKAINWNCSLELENSQT